MNFLLTPKTYFQIKKCFLFTLSFAFVVASLPSENNEPIQKQAAQSEDITELMKCYEDDCKSILDPIMKDFSLTLEYLSVLGCMKTNEQCQNIEEEEEFKVHSMKKCCIQCFSGRQFSRQIQKLNSCHLSCVQEVAQKFKPKVSELTLLESNQNHWDTYGLVIGVIVIALIGGYLLFKKRKTDKASKQLNLTKQLDLKFDSSEL